MKVNRPNEIRCALTIVTLSVICYSLIVTMARLINQLESSDIEIVGFLEARRVRKEGGHSPCFLVFAW